MKELKWKKSGDAYYLSTSTENLVRLHYEHMGHIVFWINREPFEVKQSGFWAQRYAVFKDGNKLVSLSDRFLGSTGEIRFSDGTRYSCLYNQYREFTLHFFDDKNEILNYYLVEEHGKKQAALQLGTTLWDAERLLVLASLGMVVLLFLFEEFKENNAGLHIRNKNSQSPALKN